jgi:hypothetical protein
MTQPRGYADEIRKRRVWLRLVANWHARGPGVLELTSELPDSINYSINDALVTRLHEVRAMSTNMTDSFWRGCTIT